MKMNVLAVDDNFLTRMLLKVLISKLGHNSITYANGAQGYEALVSGGTVERIITDYKMPVMDGLDFLKTIRKNKAFQNIPVLFYSGFLGELESSEFVGLVPVILEDKPIKNDVVKEFLMGENPMYIY